MITLDLPYTTETLTMPKKSYSEINQTTQELTGAFMQESKDTLNAFMQLHSAAMSEGEVSVKNKELIALGISIAARCDGCIASHVQSAIKAGATKQEIVECVNVAILMGGGPSVVYGTQALAAAEEFLG